MKITLIGFLLSILAYSSTTLAAPSGSAHISGCLPSSGFTGYCKMRKMSIDPQITIFWNCLLTKKQMPTGFEWTEDQYNVVETVATNTAYEGQSPDLNTDYDEGFKFCIKNLGFWTNPQVNTPETTCRTTNSN